MLPVIIYTHVYTLIGIRTVEGGEEGGEGGVERELHPSLFLRR